MLFVVRPGLLVVKDSTLGNASILRIEFFRLGSDGRERDVPPVLAECIDAALDEVIGALSQAGADLLL